jgi:hypothetical protein
VLSPRSHLPSLLEAGAHAAAMQQTRATFALTWSIVPGTLFATELFDSFQLGSPSSQYRDLVGTSLGCVHPSHDTTEAPKATTSSSPHPHHMLNLHRRHNLPIAKIAGANLHQILYTYRTLPKPPQPAVNNHPHFLFPGTRPLSRIFRQPFSIQPAAGGFGWPVTLFWQTAQTGRARRPTWVCSIWVSFRVVCHGGCAMQGGGDVAVLDR